MTKAYAAQTGDKPLAPASIDRRDVGPRDVQIDILYCGVCHSDLHTARGEWPGVVFPVVPGHEIVGRIVKVGAQASRHRVGQIGAVGCMVDSCKDCAACGKGLEQYCDHGKTVFTYNSPDKHFPGKMTYGGYSKSIVVDERFVLSVSEKADLAATAPLLCAGITLYSPLKHWGATKGKKVGIVGLGGLGHMGVKLSHALGAHTVLFTTSASKVEDGKRLGADEVVISRDEAQMAKHAGSLDLIVNTVSVSHNLDAFTNLLRTDGTLCLVGAPEHPHPSPSVWPLIMRRRSIAGSAIGGIPETQEMLDFCAERGIAADVEMISIDQINHAYERMTKSDVKYRFVIDMSTLK
ncbi:MAG: NAD(P)-dependent alcohol dehydrogenase [Phycisphaeraceae bacterium]|nr:NAD(P)-dependent alcohol dehydrogenase [Phycisphaeraceae bacterium]